MASLPAEVERLVVGAVHVGFTQAEGGAGFVVCKFLPSVLLSLAEAAEDQGSSLLTQAVDIACTGFMCGDLTPALLHAAQEQEEGTTAAAQCDATPDPAGGGDAQREKSERTQKRLAAVIWRGTPQHPDKGLKHALGESLRGWWAGLEHAVVRRLQRRFLRDMPLQMERRLLAAYSRTVASVAESGQARCRGAHAWRAGGHMHGT